MSTNVKALENLIRRVIREEIAKAVPDIAEYLVEHSRPAASPKRMETDNSSIRALLAQNVGWEGGSLTENEVASSIPGMIIPERGVDGRPIPPINEATKPVYEAMNQDFSAIMKKLNLT